MKTKCKIAIKCPDCPKIFRSSGYLLSHRKRMHVPLPPAPPAAITLKVTGDSFLEELCLLDGHNLDVGDVFWHKKKFLIKEITKTAGSNAVIVKAECLKREWTVHILW